MQKKDDEIEGGQEPLTLPALLADWAKQGLWDTTIAEVHAEKAAYGTQRLPNFATKTRKNTEWVM